MRNRNPDSLQYSWCKEKEHSVHFRFFLEMAKVVLIFISDFKLL